MEAINFEIKKNCAVISNSTKGWKRELNIVSWNNGQPKLDLRDWDAEHQKMGKGISLNREETIALKNALNELDAEGF